MKKIIVLILAIITCITTKAQTSLPKVVDTFHIKSSGGWDYILADTASNKLFVSHGTQVNVLDKSNGDSIGIISIQLVCMALHWCII